MQLEPSGAPFTNNTPSAAMAAPPEIETEGQSQREPEAHPEAQEPTGQGETLALVSDLPKPISALLGLRRDSAALPPESDALGIRRRREPGFLAGCLGPLSMAKQCPEVWDWVSSVFKLLRFSFDIDSVEGRRETGSFSAMYNRGTACARKPFPDAVVMLSPLPLGKKTEILVSSLKTAEQKGRKPDSHYRRGKGAVFCDILNQRLDKHLATNSGTANESHRPPQTIPDPMRATG